MFGGCLRASGHRRDGSNVASRTCSLFLTGNVFEVALPHIGGQGLYVYIPGKALERDLSVETRR